MSTPLPKGQQIVVTHLLFKGPYHMDSMQIATDHYNIGITLQGHRRTITPMYSYSYQAGDVALAPPFLFHRTLSEYDEPYERIMIKFSPEFVEPFIQKVGQHIHGKSLQGATIFERSCTVYRFFSRIFFTLISRSGWHAIQYIFK